MKDEIAFYKILYAIVRGWPATYHSSGPEERFKRLNTFAVLSSAADMYSDNLGKDSRYKPAENPGLFFSRAWADAGYKDEELKKDLPALLIWPESGNISAGLSFDETNRLKFRVCIQGRYVSSYDPGSYDISSGGQRPWEIIAAQLREMRAQLHLEIGKWVLADIEYTAGGSGQIWINEDYLETLYPATISVINNQRPISAFLSIVDNGTEVLPEIDANGLIQAFSSMTIDLFCYDRVTINHELTDPPEVLDHPGKASA